jgi:flagellar hook protein FlgE
MSLYGSLFSGVSALNAQSQSMGMISDNIANVNTVGYKRTEAAFSSLVTSQTRSTAYASGGVRASTLQRVDQSGVLQQSSSSTDIALSGNGFFVVKNSILDNLQEAYYTRAGQFSENAQGYLQSPTGKYLMGWPVDQNGNIPTSNADLASLVPVDVAFLGGMTRQTTEAEIALNLNAAQVPYAYPLSTPITQTANFNRSFRVYDSLGQAQDITMNFYKTTSPTASALGNVSIQGTTSLMDTYTSFNPSATYTGTVAIPAPQTLGATSPGLVNGDTFAISLNGENATIAIDPSWTMADFANAINSSFTGSPASVVGDQLVLNASTRIQVRAGGSQPVALSNLNAIGLDFVTQNRDPRTFTVQAGVGPTQTVTITDGMSTADLVAQINALPDINAQLDASGQLVIAADSTGQTITLGGIGGGGNQLSTAAFASLGMNAGVYNPPTAPNLLTPLDTTANAQNWWQVEIKGTDGTVLSNGMLNFNGDGTINSSGSPIALDLANITWGNGSDPQTISLDITNLNQKGSAYNVVYTNQNGAELGLRTGVSVDAQGFVIARFSNGESAKLYKLPVATFANANGLTSKNSSLYQESSESGEYNLREAGTGSAGVIESSTLEASNVDLADEFSKMIVTQRAYSAGTKIITTADQMLQELLQMR